LETHLEKINVFEELRSEVNLLIYPFFALTSKDIFSRGKSEFKTELRRREERLKVSWKVSANQEYGYPGPFTKKVHKAVEQIVERSGFPVENPIRFSIYELCQILGVSTGGSNYKKIKEALERIIATTIESKGAFYYKGGNEWIDDKFHLYDRVVFKGKQMPGGEVAETNLLYLGSWYLENINSRYLKPINFDYYKSLETNIAQRLYELLGVKFYGIHESNQPFIRYKYSTLCQLLPLHKQKYLSKAKHILDPAHQELKETNFLANVNWSGLENEKKDWYIYYLPGQRAEDEIEEFGGPPYFAKDKGKPALTEGEKINIKAWVNELSRKLNDEEGNNEGYYKKLAKLVVRNKVSEGLVRKCLSETKSEDQMRSHDPEADPIKSRSAYFTDLLKRHLKKQEKDLNDLLDDQC